MVKINVLPKLLRFAYHTHTSAKTANVLHRVPSRLRSFAIAATNTVLFITAGAVRPLILFIKLRGSAVSLHASNACCIQVASVFPTMIRVLGIATTLATFGAVSVFGVVFVQRCIPDTRGRTLESIHMMLHGHVKHTVYDSVPTWDA